MIQDNFKYFEFLKSEKIAPEVAYLEAKKQRLNTFTCIRMLRSIYGLSLSEAKSLIIMTDNKTQNTDKNAFDMINQQQRNLLKTLRISAKLIEEESVLLKDNM